MLKFNSDHIHNLEYRKFLNSQNGRNHIGILGYDVKNIFFKPALGCQEKHPGYQRVENDPEQALELLDKLE